MKNKNILSRIVRFYVDGFRQMTLGKTLWAVILIKLFVIFVVLKLFFFPNYLKQHAGDDKPDYVSTELVNRALPKQ